jgi:hypothetical protein
MKDQSLGNDFDLLTKTDGEVLITIFSLDDDMTTISSTEIMYPMQEKFSYRVTCVFLDIQNETNNLLGQTIPFTNCCLYFLNPLSKAF